MLILQILVAVGVLLLWIIFKQLSAISSQIKTVTHQLETLGAPLKLLYPKDYHYPGKPAAFG
jgi:hypothetical protein